MTDQPKPDTGNTPSHANDGAPSAQTIDQAPGSAALDAGLQAAFGDSGPPLPAGGSVLQALSASLPSVPRIHLREPDAEPLTPINKPHSDQMPQPQQLPQRYQLVGEIARGGMGAVFKGRDTDLGRDIAVKVMLEGHQGRTELLQRFVEEAQIGGQLQHPGIVPVYELGQAGDKRPYFTMKLVKGQTLAVLLKGRTDPQQDLPRFLGIFKQVCQTLAYAHARGVIHRDLKPSNIMVGAFGEVQVMDWGLAKVLPRNGDDRGSPSESAEEVSVIHTVRSDGSITPSSVPEAQAGSHTQAGTVLGTPAYMAPEQARGESDTLDERCDVFGLGALLCQILTGKPPYEGRDSQEIQQKALRAELSAAWQRLDACGAEAELIALAKQCLAPGPQQRPRHAGEVAAQVTAYEESVQARLHQAELATAAAQARVHEEQKRREAEEARAEAERQRREVEQARAEEERKRRVVEQAKAQEERKRRRVTVALAASLLLLVGGVSAAGLWYQRDQAQRESEELGREAEQLARQKYLRREVTTALAEAQQLRQQLHQQLGNLLQVHELLSDIDGWGQRVKNARLAWERAQALADSAPDLLGADLTGSLQQLKKQLQADEKDFQLAQKLDTIRLEASTSVEGKFDPAKAVAKYASVFAKAGYDVQREDVKLLAARIGRSPIRSAHVAALDHWAMATRNQQLRLKLLMLARHADPDPWRDQVRDALRGNDSPKGLWEALMKTNVQKLQRLAEQVDVSRHSPQILLALALKLPKPDDQQAALLRRALVHYPRDFWLHFGLGNLASDPAEQVGCYQAALAVRPQTSAAHLNWGNALYAKQDYAGAIRHYQQTLQIDPKDARAHTNWGAALAAKQDYTGAISHYQQALKIDPSYAPVHGRWGLALYFKQDYDGAIGHSQQALQLDPKHAPAHVNWGIALAKQQDYAGAICHYQQALKIDPNDAWAHYNWGVALGTQKEVVGAITHYQQALKIDPNFAKAHVNLGWLLQGQGNLPEAIAHYRKAVQSDPKNIQAHINLGLSLPLRLEAEAHYSLGNALRDKKDLEGAIQHFKKALQIDPKFAEAQVNLGTILRDQGNEQEAMSHFKEALRSKPGLLEAHNNLAWLLQGQGNLPEAIDHYQKVLEIDPKNASAHRNLGYIRERQGELPEAIDHYQKAIQSDPKNTWAYATLGHIRYKQGDLAGAIDYCRKALQIDPKDAWAHRALGYALEKSGDLPGAVDHYRKALKFEPTFPLAEKKLRSCEQFLSLDEKLPAILEGKVQPKDVAEQLTLAELCLKFKKQYVAAVRFYTAAFAAQPLVAEDLSKEHRYQAACAAVLAAIGPGEKGAQHPQKKRAELRQQALAWLQADLTLRKQHFQKGLSLTVALTDEQLRRWQTEPSLANVREAKALAQLPREEQPAWQQLWADVDQLLRQTRANCTATRQQGKLTTEKREQIHEVKMTAGRTYVLEMETKQFAPVLRLENVQGVKLVEGRGSAGEQNDQIRFLAPQDGTYRVVATSFRQTGTGNYTLTIREYAGKKE